MLNTLPHLIDPRVFTLTTKTVWSLAPSGLYHFSRVGGGRNYFCEEGSDSVPLCRHKYRKCLEISPLKLHTSALLLLIGTKQKPVRAGNCETPLYIESRICNRCW